MKTLRVQIPDEVYERIQQRAVARGATLDQEVVDLLEGIPTEPDVQLAAARTRMRELFRTVKGFRLASAIPREELYERGSFRWKPEGRGKCPPNWCALQVAQNNLEGS